MNRFGDYTSHGNTYIGETLDQLLNGHCNVQSIPNISVVQRNGKWFTSDNRRLWVFRKAEEIGFLKTIYVNEAYYIRDDKLTTENGGTSIRVRGGGPGGSLWRTWKPKRPPTTTTHVNYNSNRGYSTNRNTRSSYSYSDHNSNGNTDTETDSDIDIDDTNPYIAQNYNRSHVEYNFRKNNEWNEDLPYRLNSNVETTRPAPLPWRFDWNDETTRTAAPPSRLNSNVETTRPAAPPSRLNSNVETTRPAAQPSRLNSNVETTRPVAQPSRFNSNVETTRPAARDHSIYDIEYNSHRRDHSYKDPDKDPCCCIIL